MRFDGWGSAMSEEDDSTDDVEYDGTVLTGEDSVVDEEGVSVCVCVCVN